jgi:hypothetical protein
MISFWGHVYHLHRKQQINDPSTLKWQLTLVVLTHDEH